MASLNSEVNNPPPSVQESRLSDTLSRISPQPHSTSRYVQGRERRNPSVTPRKFRRFFTPRLQTIIPASSARQALRELSAPSLNQLNSPDLLPPFRDGEGQENALFPRGLKRRKMLHQEPSPKHTGFTGLQEDKQKETSWENPQSSPCARTLRLADESDDEALEIIPTSRAPVKRIIPIRNRGLGAQLLGRSTGIATCSGGQRYVGPVNDYQDETSSFYTRPDDVYRVTSMHQESSRCIPFCVTPCNTNSLVALGDEEGRVRLIESENGDKSSFSKYHLAVRVHMNAVIDMTFSDDDQQLATASGDQTARVMDMLTQTTTAILASHTASLKQVRFQPGNNKILATSSRDGVVQIWDLRCKGEQGPKNTMSCPVQGGERVKRASNQILYGRPVNSIFDAHRTWNRTTPHLLGNQVNLNLREGTVETRSGSVSITAMQFLPPGQEHLLLTACEADASVRLWDIRFLYNRSKISPTPISITKAPDTHSNWRHFGINSINLSSDGSRFYTLCKDNTVYAYSTAHLIAGRAPELASTTTNRPGPQRDIQEGLGPMYGFRHPKLHATTFYVKSALRAAKDGKSEMLAVGSSDHCAVLFPTDERYLSKPHYPESISVLSGHANSSGFGPPLPMLRRPTVRRLRSGVGISGRVEDSIPISTNGTPLIRAHDAEVNALTWSNDGDLITVGDDFIVRCWREGLDARTLRQGGETGGRRWCSGWAEVDDRHDEDDHVELGDETVRRNVR